MARETNSVSERAARRQRREQAAAAAEVNESNWTTVVEVTATPKRAAVLATPDADARGALATDAGVPNAELTPPQNREQAIANAGLIPPQTHREPANADADVIPPQQPPHSGVAAHGLYDDIPLPRGMPRWVTADERPMACNVALPGAVQ